MGVVLDSAVERANQPLDLEHHLQTHWYAVHTKPGAETRVALNLATLRLEVLNPQTVSGSARGRLVALFPQYVFARVPSDALRVVRFTRGVSGIVAVAGTPAPIDEAIVAAIRKRIGADGLVVLDLDVREGDRVFVTSGPFREFEGVFQRSMKSGHRVMVLLQMLHSSLQIVVPQTMLQRARP